ncbi:hypothetical protein REPUB_Repub20aG0116400 [Reevesia pubescens]
MGDAREPSAPSCGEPSIHDSKSSNKTASEKRKWEPIRLMRRRYRAGFSRSISSIDLASLSTEVERIDVPSPTASPEDCSTSTQECIEPSVESTESRSIASIESVESEPTSSKASTSSDSEHHHILATIVQWRGFFRLLKKGPGIPSQSLPKLTRRNSKRIRDDMVPTLSSALDAELCCFKSTWKNFTLLDLQEATDNFSRENLIGEGGYAEVYKGKLTSGKLVAIKRLTRGSPEEMTMDFLSELGIIVHVDHPNIAKLIGYGVEGGMHLVLQLSPNGSLASLLYGPKEKLNWNLRFKIAIGTAEGLSYLHEGCQRRIIHKDIKASNILLTEEFDAQISDFGLAKWLPDQWTHHIVSKVEGTFGYLPPEFFMHGIVDEKTDVYAFGVMLLELITGRQALDSSQQSLVMWAKPLIKENKIKELVDPTLGDAYDWDQLNRVTATASICIHQSAMNRPQMSQVVDILKGDLRCLETLKQHEKTILRRTYSEEIYDAEEYNSTKAFVYEGFLTDLECDHLISLAKSELKRSAVADNVSGKSKLSEVRTSSGMFIPKGKDPIVAGIEDKISTWTFLPKENGEDMQILRYEHGQKYDPHYDYFADKVNIARGGHRIATVLMYLTDVTKGGETVFPQAEESSRRKTPAKDDDLSECAKKGIAVKPRRGDALLFFSLSPTAIPDPISLHAGCPVIEGEKWSATKWIHVDSFDKNLEAGGNCTDLNESCERWAALGECTKNQEYMIGSAQIPGYCRRSCKVC